MNELLYGTCTKLPCRCLREGWQNDNPTLCPNWERMEIHPETASKDDIIQLRAKLEAITAKHGKEH